MSSVFCFVMSLKITLNLFDRVARKALYVLSFRAKYPNLYINLKLVECRNLKNKNFMEQERMWPLRHIKLEFTHCYKRELPMLLLNSMQYPVCCKTLSRHWPQKLSGIFEIGFQKEIELIYS